MGRNVLAGKRLGAGALWEWFNLSSFLDWLMAHRRGLPERGTRALESLPRPCVLWVRAWMCGPGGCPWGHVCTFARASTCLHLCVQRGLVRQTSLLFWTKKGLSCRASLLFAIIWQVALCEAAELKRRITLMKPLMGVGGAGHHPGNSSL